MFIEKVNLILFSNGLSSSSSGITRQSMKYEILTILSRANKVLSLDNDGSVNKRNLKNNINFDNFKQLEPIGLDYTIYDEYFDFIFVGSWADPIISNKSTYFGFVNTPENIDKNKLVRSIKGLKSNTRYNIFKVINTNQLISVSTLDVLSINDYYNNLESDIRNYNINKIVN